MTQNITDEDILKVKRNLVNMQAFNDQVYTRGNPKITNAYVLLSQQDNNDCGLKVVTNLLEGSFWAIGGELGAIGAIGANMFCGIVNDWDNIPPPDMSNIFSSLMTRFEAASRDIDQQLAVYHDYPETYWNKQFTYLGQTCTLADLATIDFPAEADTNFALLLNPALFALDQTIWKILLCSSCQNVRWQPDATITVSDINSWLQSFYSKNPSYWCSYYWHQDSGSCGDSSYWNVTEHNISTGAGLYHDGHISQDACNYLFIDSIDGCIINANGLYTRNQVFNDLGLSTTTIYEPYGKQKNVSQRYKNAMLKCEPTLSSLVKQKSTTEIKNIILDAIQNNPVLYQTLQTRKYQTLEQILQVKIPEVVNFNIIFENGRNYGLIIPSKL
jgi:hypothetical protein